MSTELAPLERTITQTDMVAYAGATWDWHPLHHDAAYITRAGLAGTVVDGQMLGALFAEQVLDHFGPRARLTTLSIRYRAMVFAGQTVRCEGTATARMEGTVEVELTARAGDKVAATGRATVRVPEEG